MHSTIANTVGTTANLRDLADKAGVKPVSPMAILRHKEDAVKDVKQPNSELVVNIIRSLNGRYKRVKNWLEIVSEITFWGQFICTPVAPVSLAVCLGVKCLWMLFGMTHGKVTTTIHNYALIAFAVTFGFLLITWVVALVYEHLIGRYVVVDWVRFKIDPNSPVIPREVRDKAERFMSEAEKAGLNKNLHFELEKPVCSKAHINDPFLYVVLPNTKGVGLAQEVCIGHWVETLCCYKEFNPE